MRLEVTETRTYVIDDRTAAAVLRLLVDVNDGDEDAKAQLAELLTDAQSDGDEPLIVSATVQR